MGGEVEQDTAPARALPPPLGHGLRRQRLAERRLHPAHLSDAAGSEKVSRLLVKWMKPAIEADRPDHAGGGRRIHHALRTSGVGGDGSWKWRGKRRRLDRRLAKSLASIVRNWL